MVCMLAHSVNEPDQRDEALANARLICAAPDMAEALRAFIAYNQGDWDQGPEHDAAYQRCVDIARAALAKAAA